jgi:hypothetical protein
VFYAGLVDDLKPKFKIAWNDENNPALGFKHLYLSDADYKALPEVTHCCALRCAWRLVCMPLCIMKRCRCML